jgi:hypothetical protein
MPTSSGCSPMRLASTFPSATLKDAVCASTAPVWSEPVLSKKGRRVAHPQSPAPERSPWQM